MPQGKPDTATFPTRPRHTVGAKVHAFGDKEQIRRLTGRVFVSVCNVDINCTGLVWHGRNRTALRGAVLQEVIVGRLASRFELAQRAAIDFGIGALVFAVLAFGMSVDRTGNSGAFLSVSQFAPPYAHASDYRPAQNAAGIGSDRAALNTRAQATASHISSQTVFARTDQSAALVFLAIIFSTVFAFNLAFFRHLRVVYGSRRHGFLRKGAGPRGS